MCNEPFIVSDGGDIKLINVSLDKWYQIQTKSGDIEVQAFDSHVDLKGKIKTVN